MSFRAVLIFVLCISFPLVVGTVLTWVTAEGITTWYATLKKPAFNPSAEMFGTVWTGIYALMGISLFLVWMSPEDEVQRKARHLFFIQLALNAGWCLVLFQYRQVGWALWVLTFLWIYIIRMIFQFRNVNYLAALLQLPNLAWVSFALVLQATIWWMNLF